MGVMGTRQGYGYQRGLGYGVMGLSPVSALNLKGGDQYQGLAKVMSPWLPLEEVINIKV